MFVTVFERGWCGESNFVLCGSNVCLCKGFEEDLDEALAVEVENVGKFFLKGGS